MASQAPQRSLERSQDLIRLMTDGLVNIVDTSGDFLLRLEDGSIIDTKGWGGWEWTHGIALTALYRHAALSPSSPANAHSLSTLLEWFRAQNTRTNGKGAPKNINTMSPFYGLAGAVADGLVPEGEKAVWSAWLDEWAEWVMRELPRTQQGGFQHITYNAEHKDQMWDDTLMMTVVPLAKIGKLFDRPEYVQEAIYQFLLHIQYLMDPATGLWYHGWQFDASGGRGHNFARALWARGNCWITVSIPVFLEVLGLPPSDPVYRLLASTLQRQVDSLMQLVDEQTGLFHTLLVDPSSYVETSAAAGFAAGTLMALKMGILPDEPRYHAFAERVLAGVVAQIQPDGEVANVSFGTGMGPDLDFYKAIPITSMPYGQALAMWALVEWQRLKM